MQEPIRRRLLHTEIREQYPWFPEQYLVHPYCFIADESGEKRLAIIKVELADFPHQVLRKHQKQLHDFREYPPFGELIDQKRFVMVTVTTTPERRQFLEEAFESDPWYPPFCVCDYPLLCDLL